MTFLLANWRLVLVGLLLLALGVQTARVNINKAEFAAYRADIQKQVAENKAKAALEQARMASNATKALDDLQVRLDSVRRSYRILRDRSASTVPGLSDAASVLGSCTGDPSQPNPAARLLEQVEGGVLGVLEKGDAEISKYVELWTLEQRNAALPKP